MELQDFIKQTLVEIITGVKDAIAETKDTGAIINPDKVRNGEISSQSGLRAVQNIEINVAISVTGKDGGKSGIGVITGLFSAGGTISNENENSQVSTVKFSIPVALPASPVAGSGPHISFH